MTLLKEEKRIQVSTRFSKQLIKKLKLVSKYYMITPTEYIRMRLGVSVTNDMNKIKKRLK